MKCDKCYECLKDEIDEYTKFPVVISRFIVCPDCGNKRCPKATFHGNKCSGSNEVGQEGSRYNDGYVLTPQTEREE